MYIMSKPEELHRKSYVYYKYVPGKRSFDILNHTRVCLNVYFEHIE